MTTGEYRRTKDNTYSELISRIELLNRECLTLSRSRSHPILPSHSIDCQIPTMDALKATFSKCKDEGRAAFVTYVTAGYPTSDETVSILLGMEAGGAGNVTTDGPNFIPLIFDRYNRAWPPLYRSNCRRANDTTSKHPGSEEWCYCGVNA